MKIKVIAGGVLVLMIATYVAYVSISSEKVNIIRRKVTKNYFGTDTIVTVFDKGKEIARFKVPNGKITTPVSENGYPKGYWFCDSKEYGQIQSNLGYIASDDPIPTQ